MFAFTVNNSQRIEQKKKIWLKSKIQYMDHQVLNSRHCATAIFNASVGLRKLQIVLLEIFTKAIHTLIIVELQANQYNKELIEITKQEQIIFHHPISVSFFFFYCSTWDPNEPVGTNPCITQNHFSFSVYLVD